MQKWINEYPNFGCYEAHADDIVPCAACGSEEIRYFYEWHESGEENPVTHEKMNDRNA